MGSIRKYYPAIWCSLLVLLLAPACKANGSAKEDLRLGILPTFNAGGDSFGAVFGQHLALKLLDGLKSESVATVLLNPGGFYNASDDDWLLDYGRQSGVNKLLITTLLKTETPQSGNWTIAVQSEILDLKSGKRSQPWKSTVGINKRDAKLDYTTLHMTAGFNFYLGPSRVFEKQPLGKAMAEIAGQVRTQVLQAIPEANGTSLKAVQPSPTAGCDVRLKVLYSSKHSASRSYTAFVDGKDESFSIDDGVLLLHEKSGPMLLQVTVNDAPYKLPRQELYQASEYVDCSRPERDLVMKVGAAGEALFEWH